MPRLMGKKAFAQSALAVELFGRRVNPSTVTRYLQAGKLVEVDGKIDIDASIDRMRTLGVGKIRPDVATRHASKTFKKGHHAHKTHAHGSSITQRKKNAPEREFQADDAAGAPPVGSRTQYKAALLAYENQSLKLALALATGRRVPRVAALDAAGALGNSLRAAVERLIDQTAPRLAVTRDHARRAALIAAQTARIRRAILREYVAHLRRLRRLRGLARSNSP